MAEVRIGEIRHFYNKIGVGVLALEGPLGLDDTIHILGHTTDFQQQVLSLQIEHQAVEQAGPGDDVALKVVQRVRRGDRVFKIVDES